MADNATGSDSLLFLTDEQLRKGIEAMFFAYRGFTAFWKAWITAAPITAPSTSSTALRA
jgi:hypothetical protein